MLQVNWNLFGDHGCPVLDEKKFNLRVMIAEVGVELAGIANRRGLYLALDMAPGMPRFFQGDSLRFKEIVRSLMIHSFDYIDFGGVTMSVDSSPLSAERYSVEIVITGSGPGIPPERMKTLFKPISSSGDCLSPVAEKGLHGAKSWAELMGGDVSVHNSYGWGARYCVNVVLAVSQPLAVCDFS